ncbi:MAG: CPBP family intramembrane metalloprotease [Gallicola sp.]|nr:CPBP family intramembrane metalloprotease [Gallicola sp.]
MEKVGIVKLKEFVKEEKFLSIAWAIVITMASSVVLNLGALITAGLSSWLSYEMLAAILALSVLISFVAVPILLYEKLLDYKDKINLDYKVFFLFLFLFLFLIQFVEFSMAIHFLAIGVGEEYLFRKIHFDYLKEKGGVVFSLIVTSVLFAFLLHLNESFLSNLLIRFPLGILLGLIRIRWGTPAAAGIHWIYNVLTTLL